jgi:hypothetical protein
MPSLKPQSDFTFKAPIQQEAFKKKPEEGQWKASDPYQERLD